MSSTKDMKCNGKPAAKSGASGTKGKSAAAKEYSHVQRLSKWKAGQSAAKESFNEALRLSKSLDMLTRQRKARLALWTDSKDSKADVTALDASIEATQKALGVAKAALASVYGDKPVPFVLPISAQFSTSGGAGVLSGPLAIDVSSATEWSSLSSLFDEFRVMHGQFAFQIQAPAGALTTSGGTTFSPNSLFAIGWDPADSNAATSTRTVTELGQHMLLASSMRYAGAAGSYSGVFEGLHRFNFNVNKHADLIVGGAPSVNASPGYWKQTVAPGTDGWLKPYLQTLNGTLNDVALSGIIYLHIQLRSRT